MASHRFRWSIIALAALLSGAVAAQPACDPTPEKYRDLEFGDARFAVEEDCRHTFTQDEQFFLAGIAQYLRSTCKLPRDTKDRALVEWFAKAASHSLDLQTRQGALPDDRASAFAAANAVTEDLRCNGPEAALLARGIVLYLRRPSPGSRFIEGCVAFYTPRHGEKECRCMADAVRPVIPDVDEHFFDRALVKESIHQSPRVALTLMTSCGVQTY